MLKQAGFDPEKTPMKIEGQDICLELDAEKLKDLIISKRPEIRDVLTVQILNNKLLIRFKLM